MANARIQRRYSHCELANFEQHTDSLRAAFKKSVRFIEQFPVVDRGLLFHGAHGVGKTHLAVSVLKAAIRDKGARGYFYETGELLKLVRDTYDAGAAVNEMDVLRPVLEADLLVLDDLGVEKTSEWVQETLGHVINIRYSEQRPTDLYDQPDRSRRPTAPAVVHVPLGRPHAIAALRNVPLDRDGCHRRQRSAGCDARGDSALAEAVAGVPSQRRTIQVLVPPKTTGQLRAEPRIPRERDGKADLKWPGGRAGSQ